MKKSFVFMGAFFFAYTLSAQPFFHKQWDARFGGLKDETLTELQQTADGGCILGGFTYSGIGGDKTQPNWDTVPIITPDFWVVKVDASGNKEWEKRFGGTGSDGMWCVRQTKEGGYILFGLSGGGIDGDKTEMGRGGADYWIVKTDAFGNKEWDKRFGGTGDDFAYGNIEQTSDGGYILAGSSSSGIGGDKTESNWSSSFPYVDYWVVKIDSAGQKQWDKRFGGTQDDWLQTVKQTSDGGYILGGFSNSDSSGNKTQPVWGDLFNRQPDYWIVKIDSVGHKEWDKRFGTTKQDKLYSVLEMNGGGYILFGGGEVQMATKL